MAALKAFESADNRTLPLFFSGLLPSVSRRLVLFVSLNSFVSGAAVQGFMMDMNY